MQFLVISHQLWEIAFSVLIGLFLGLVYDGIRFVRKILSPIGINVLIANIFDVLYGIFCGAVYCVFVYYASSGRFRWFTALGMVLGFTVYRILPGRIIKPLLYFFADKFLLLLSFLLLPLKKAVTIIRDSVTSLIVSAKRRRMIGKTEKMKRSLYSEISI